jgi:uncharacterized protein YciI
MAWIAICRDATGRDTAALRSAHRDRHFAYIESILERVLAAGPLAEPGSHGHRSSLFIYDVASEAEARALLEADPYFTAGIYGEVCLEPWWPAAGRWLGGTIWQRRDD